MQPENGGGDIIGFCLPLIEVMPGSEINVQLIKPFQALCSDRRITSRESPDPYVWLRRSVPDSWSIFTFHFFVDWNRCAVGRELWLTRLLVPDTLESLLSTRDDAIRRLLYSSGFIEELRQLSQFAQVYGQTVFGVLLPEVGQTELNLQTPVWRVDVGHASLSKLSLHDLMQLIRQLSGGPVKMGTKGLTWGNSSVECFLATTNACYPGDVDAVVVDATNRVRFVLEFKKHTLTSALDEHLVTRYYRKKDYRKYTRLWLLTEHYRRLSPDTPFLILYYGTSQPVIRIQRIEAFERTTVRVGYDSGTLNLTSIDSESVSSVVKQQLRKMGILE